MLKYIVHILDGVVGDVFGVAPDAVDGPAVTTLSVFDLSGNTVKPSLDAPIGILLPESGVTALDEDAEFGLLPSLTGSRAILFL